VQPGELATVLSFSAPVSLFFFFTVIYVLATIRRIDIHPMNYLLLAGAFFAFHLLFAYSVDHLTVESAFLLSSVVSVLLVVSYLRLVVSATFALREAAAAQIVYLIGFSLAHFWEGFTGLTVTVLAIVTLFLLMQLTGRVQWSEVLKSPPRNPSPSVPTPSAPTALGT
jgi:inner membrane protein involved in colicin E2 resistance